MSISGQLVHLLSPPCTQLSHVAPRNCLHAIVATPRATALAGRLNQVRVADGSQTLGERTARRKPPAGSTGRKAIPSNALRSAESTTRHIGRHGHPLHPTPSPAVSALSCCWIQMVSGERVRSTKCATIPHFNQSHSASHSCHPPIPSKYNYPVLWRQASDEAVGVGTLAAVAANLHTGDSGHMVALH